MMNRCPTCDQFIQDHRYDVLVRIAQSCQRLREFDILEQTIYSDYKQDNAEQYLENMVSLHKLTEEEVTFIRSV